MNAVLGETDEAEGANKVKTIMAEHGGTRLTLAG